MAFSDSDNPLILAAGELYDNGRSLVDHLTQEWSDQFADGVQGMDVVRFALNTARILIEHAEEVCKDFEQVGEAKREWVVAAIEEIYNEIDPDWPWFPGFIERAIESWIFSSVLP